MISSTYCRLHRLSILDIIYLITHSSISGISCTKHIIYLITHSSISGISCTRHIIYLITHSSISGISCTKHIIYLITHSSISGISCTRHIIYLITHSSISGISCTRRMIFSPTLYTSISDSRQPCVTSFSRGNSPGRSSPTSIMPVDLVFSFRTSYTRCLGTPYSRIDFHKCLGIIYEHQP